MSKDKFPFMHFDIGAWWKDNEVQGLDHHHKGIWFELILIMFESPERGVLLQQNGQQMSNTKAARRLGLLDSCYDAALKTLLDEGVARQREDGAIFSEYMVRKEKERLNKSRAGKASAEARLLQQNDEQKGNTPINREPNRKATASNTNTNTSINTDTNSDPKNDNGAANTPDYSHITDPAELKKLETAEELLAPCTSPAIQSSNQFLLVGKRPMREWSHIWLTPFEMVKVLDELHRAGMDKADRRAVFDKVQARITTKVGNGERVEKISAFNYLTGFELTNAIDQLGKKKNLERQTIYSNNAKER